MNKIERQFFDDREAMFDSLADRLAARLGEGLAANGRAGLVVPGGSTPGPLFQRLSKKELDWSKVTIVPSDERWVSPDDPASNEKLLRETLLIDKAADARLIGLWNDTPTPAAGETVTARALAEMPDPMDVVLLGMGADGHTASLFPGADNLLQAVAGSGGKPCCAIQAPGAAQPRITLTGPVLLKSKEVILLITGDEKRRVLGQALQEGPFEDMPVRAVLHQHVTPVTIYWAH
ncbi:MAG: 6-phosphogluconolactonase [Acidobacteriota bacterium]|nr:6-phosphogluconolactonase [Acidobacteriota bacterium]